MRFIPKNEFLKFELISKSFKQALSEDFYKESTLKIIQTVKPKTLSWKTYYYNSTKENLLKNGDFQEETAPLSVERIDNLKHWNISHGGDGFIFEMNKSPLSKTGICLVTSYSVCSRSQIVNLSRFNPQFLQSLPIINCSTWYQGRNDGGSRYSLNISLFDEKNVLIDTREQEVTTSGEWKELLIVFDSYKRPVHFIHWNDEGKDSNPWAGHYGSKISNSRIYFS